MNKLEKLQGKKERHQKNSPEMPREAALRTKRHDPDAFFTRIELACGRFEDLASHVAPIARCGVTSGGRGHVTAERSLPGRSQRWLPGGFGDWILPGWPRR